MCKTDLHSCGDWSCQVTLKERTRKDARTQNASTDRPSTLESAAYEQIQHNITKKCHNLLKHLFHIIIYRHFFILI